MKKLTTQGYWNDAYKKLTGQRRSFPRINRNRNEFEIALLLQRVLKNKQGCKFLEMGCGNSIWLPYVSETFKYSVAGIDYSEAGVSSALANLQVRHIEGNIFRVNFLNDNEIASFGGSWDVVFSLGVIEHFDQPDFVIDKFSRCLKSTGIMITVVPNLFGLMGKIQKRIDTAIFSMHQQISQDDLVSFHKNNGLTIMEYGSLGFLDFSMLNFSQYGRLTAYIGRIIRLLDLPLLVLYKLRLKFSSPFLSSFFYVVAEKR